MRNLCKFLVPFLVPIMSIALIGLLYLGIIDKIEMHPIVYFLSEVLGYLVVDCLLVVMYYKVYPRLFAAKMPFHFKVPDRSIIMGLVLLVPGIWFLLDEIVIVVGEMLGNPIVQDSVEGDTLM